MARRIRVSALRKRYLFPPGVFTAGPLLLPGAPFTPEASWLGCVAVGGAVPPVPVAVPVASLSPGARVAGPVRVSGGPFTPGAEFGGEGD